MAEAPILVTGATGHVGSRLVEELLRRGKKVRAMSREPLDRDGVETVQADVLDGESLESALAGVGAAYYLVHALASDGGFGEEERTGAQNFVAAAEAAGVTRIVYLGGIAHDDDLSEHLQTRKDVGEVLRSSSVLAIELQASIVIGEGSASFELVRSLVDYLPVLVLPDWIESHCQPIALSDVIAYLVESLDVEVPGSAVFEIGGANRITYRDLLDLYGKSVGSSRPTIALPALPIPFAGWVTGLAPEQARVAAKLVESLRFDTSVQDEAARHAFSIEPLGVREAIARVTEPQIA